MRTKQAFNHALMKRHLIFCAIAASAASHAANTTVNAQEQQKAAVSSPPVSMRNTQASQRAVPVRHLSDAERAELRRQLQQFNSQHSKRS